MMDIKRLIKAGTTHRFMHTILGALSLSVAVFCQAESQLTYICTLEDDTRTITIEYPTTEPVPCLVKYKKYGTSQTLWKAKSAHGYCEEKAQVLLDKRRQLGWFCQSENIVAVD